MWRINFKQMFSGRLQTELRRRHNNKSSIHTSGLEFDAAGLSYVSGKASCPLNGATIGQVLDRAVEKFETREAFVVCHQNIRKTFAQFKKDVDTLATGLIATDLHRGDRVGIWSPNSYEWVLMQYATAKLGLILVAINPAYQPQELSYVLAKAEIKALVAAPDLGRACGDLYEGLIEIIPEIPVSQAGMIKSNDFPKLNTLILMTDNYHRGAYAFRDIMGYGGNRETKMLQEIGQSINFDDTINIHFSSGTTGRPKAIPLTHHSLVNNAMFIGRRLNYHIQPERVCLMVPLYHCFGSVAGTLCSVIHGCTTILPAHRFSATASLTAIERERCSSLYGTPTMFIDMMHRKEFPETDFSHVKTGIIGGAPCLPMLMYSIMTKFNCSGITVMYGSTETGPIVAAHHANDDIGVKIAGVGSALDHVEIKIVDSNDSDTTLPIGAHGEICVRGSMVMKGYLDEQRTKETLKDNGWFLTGDIGSLNEDGLLQVVGRKKDMICRGGEKIFPREIENCLLENPDIQDAHVFGIPDVRTGEEVCAWIKMRGDQISTEKDIKTFCKSKVAHFKIPKHICFVDDFPKNAVGKVSKMLLRESMVRYMESKNTWKMETKLAKEI